MQVLLNEDIKKLGYRGDIVAVKRGYFRNYLYPRGMAQIATAKVVELAEGRNKKRLMQKEQILDNSKDVLSKLKGLRVTVKSKVSDKGKLYGSIAEVEVIEAVKAATNLELEKDFIRMDHIKEIGEHEVIVHLGEGLEEKILVVVEAA